jgi:arylsulfatase A-like enzyme
MDAKISAARKRGLVRGDAMAGAAERFAVPVVGTPPPEPYRSLYPEDPYAAEVAYVDSQVGVLIDELERRGLLSQAAVIVAADHGESFGEHGEQGHGMLVYQDVLHVPLIIRAPGVGHRRIPGVVSLVDVMPTVLDLIGAPTVKVDGASLVPSPRTARRTPSRCIRNASEGVPCAPCATGGSS